MKRFAMIAALAVLLTGCSSRELGEALTEDGAAAGGQGTGATEIAQEVPAIGVADGEAVQDMSQPPQMFIETRGAEISSCMAMTTGTYCWTVDDGSGQAAGTCVDCISPYEMVQQGMVTAHINISMLEASPRVLLNYGAKLVSAKRCSESGDTDISFTEDGVLTLPMTDELTAYCVGIEFPQGTVYYVFSASADGVQDDEPTDDELTTPAYDPTTQTSMGQLPGNIVPEEPVYTPAPPEIELLLTSGNASWTSITAQCSYYWESEVNGDPTTVTFDSPSPYEFAYSDDIKLGVVDISDITEDVDVLLPHNAELTNVLCHSGNDTQQVGFTPSGKIHFPEEPIGNVYSLEVTFPEGVCTCVFVTGSEPDFPSYDDEGLWHADGRISYSTSEFDCPSGAPYVIDSLEDYVTFYGVESTAYNRRYFEQGALLVWTFSEGSGSISHEYLGINENNEVLVRRVTPEVGTCDMAYYQLTIEVPYALANAEYTLKFIDEYDGFDIQPMEPAEDDVFGRFVNLFGGIF